MPHQIHQMLPTLGYGDAIGNHVLALRKLFRSSGYESEIFAERWHPRLSGECRHFQEYHRFSHEDNLVLLHYSIGGEINTYATNLPDQVLLYYHNITPAHFFYDVNGELARQLQEARRQLQTLAGKVPAIAGSEYNANELAAMGFKIIGVAPYFVTFDQLDQNLQSQDAHIARQRFAAESSFDWLYVGRLAPNKCVEDVIAAFYYYHSWIQPDSRLLLVGSGEGLDPYVNKLYKQVSRLGLDGDVIFTGPCTDEALPAFFKMANVYVSMSDHEGFCVPILEAMHYQVPVVAYASTAVPYTIGQAGVLIRQKLPVITAEVVHEIEVNELFRQQLIATQQKRLQDFSFDNVKRALAAALAPFSVQVI
jgi:L-malate glycosyltransferase